MICSGPGVHPVRLKTILILFCFAFLNVGCDHIFLNTDCNDKDPSSECSTLSLLLYHSVLSVTPQYMYTSVQGSNQVIGYSLDRNTGGLIQNTIIGGLNQPAQLAIHSGADFLLIGLNGTNTVEVYRIDPSTGSVSILNSITAAGLPRAIAVDEIRDLVYIAANPGNLSSYKMNRIDGSLQIVDSKSVTSTPYTITLGAGGQQVYVTANGSNQLYAFASNNGSLTALAGSPLSVGNEPVAFDLNESETFGYVAGFTSNQIEIMRRYPDGTLSNVGSIPAASGMDSMIVDPLNRFVITSDEGMDQLQTYSMNIETGSLALLSSTTVGSTPFHILMGPDGRWMYVPCSGVGQLYALQMNSTGIISLLNPPNYAVGSQPIMSAYYLEYTYPPGL